MSIVLSKQKFLLIGIIVLTLILAGAAVLTVILLQSRTTVSPTPTKAASCGTQPYTLHVCQDGTYNKCTTANPEVGTQDCIGDNGGGFGRAIGTCNDGATRIDFFDSSKYAQCVAGGGVGGGTVKDCQGKTGLIALATGGTLRLINCNAIGGAQVPSTCTKTVFTCDSTSGSGLDPATGKATCASSPNSSKTDYNLNPQETVDVSAGAGAPSCGSKQYDVSCTNVAGTAGAFYAAGTSCTTTTTTTPVTQTTSVTVTTTIPFTTTAIPNTRTPQDTPISTPTGTPSTTPSNTPVVVVTTVVPTTTKVLPNTGLFEDLILPTLVALVFIVVGGVLANRQFKK